ncbi:MAG: DNA-binding protein [Nitrosopumilaceae archaeon]|jgi:programmed cell death protein 5|uniref:DNA-binding protein n=1 Tax=Candidatus Nitrosomaritimum aestuariumsis TaxID=3342354 RepID=A0AC60W741_9ARCH|nr:DNA-binding protein [Nitrosopumilaceae archaeon]MBA4462365.1 DNA-binding protein [Nitrosopumilaceae archaeon]MBA4463050.1 DNA-binding protein [Nitrosopumilaceae archaeon]NCF22619.1 DNA-binding protein [Nitrosopumilaceae archaeon]
MSFPDSNESQDKQINEEEFNAQKENILKQILTSEARMRLNNIKMVKPELSNLVEQYLIGMASQGKMPSQINDDQLKQILLSIQQPKRDFKINRI